MVPEETHAPDQTPKPVPEVAASYPEEPVAEAPKILSERDLLRMGLAESRVELARCYKLLRVHELEAMLAKAQLRVKECDDSVRRRTRELLSLREELGATYGVNFSSDTVSYDDATGQIFVTGTASAPSKE